MVRFYDAKDEADLARVEKALARGGVEYFVSRVPGEEVCGLEIRVAEEDLPMAEELLADSDKE